MIKKIKTYHAILIAAGVVNFSSAGLWECMAGCFDFARETRNYLELPNFIEEFCSITDKIGTELKRILPDSRELSIYGLACLW